MSSLQERITGEQRLAQLMQGAITSAEILQKEFQAPSWIVPGILPEGLAILAGKPKVGKSWFALNLAIAVSLGGRVLGSIEAERRETIYLALEDTERRLRKRLDTLNAVGTDRLFFYTAWRRGEDGLGDLRLLLAQHPECRLVVIDTLGRIRAPEKELSYQGDVDEIAALKAIADSRHVTILLVHHLRKAEANDYVDCVSGTLGLVGAADTILILRRGRGQADAKLSITGRDVEEMELALRYENNIGWTILGDAKEYAISAERAEVLDILRKSLEPMSAKEVAEALDKPYGAVRKLFSRLAREGFVHSERYGKYSPGNKCHSGDSHTSESVPSVTGVPGVTTVPTVTDISSREDKGESS